MIAKKHYKSNKRSKRSYFDSLNGHMRQLTTDESINSWYCSTAILNQGKQSALHDFSRMKNSRQIIPIQFQNVLKIPCLLDSGSDNSIISSEILQKLLQSLKQKYRY